MSRRVVVLGAGFGGLELSDDALRGGRRRRRGDADRQERHVRLRLLEARRDVRPDDAGRGPPEVPRHREARRAGPEGDDHRDRPRGEAGDDRRRRPRGRRARHRARRRLRHGRHARARRGRQRVLLGGRRGAAGRGHAGVHRGPRGHRRVRRAVQVPPGAERVRAAPPRRAGRARRPRRLPDLVRDPAGCADPPGARRVRGAPRGVRRARHRVHAGPPDHLDRSRAQRRCCWTTGPSSSSTSSSACRSTALPTWSSPAA